MERHGEDHIGGEASLPPGRSHARTERPGQAAAVVVLELMNGVAERVGEDGAGCDPVEVGRRFPANWTEAVGVLGMAATNAGRRGWRLDARLVRVAEGEPHAAAAGAARGKEQIKYRLTRGHQPVPPIASAGMYPHRQLHGRVSDQESGR